MFGFHFNLSAISLLKEAGEMYDQKQLIYAPPKSMVKNDFQAGAKWMHRCLETIRGERISYPETVAFNVHGFVKNGVAGTLSMIVWGIGIATHSIPLILASTLVFYLIEVQMVFLFPLLIDQDPTPFQKSRHYVVRGGGTIKAMSVVMPISAFMMIGGLLGQGIVRSWCIGCLAVVLWYEKARTGKK